MLKFISTRAPPSSSFARHAHLSSTPLSAHPSAFPPPPASSFSPPATSDPPLCWSDPSYLARYRDPAAHDRRLLRKPFSHHHSHHPTPSASTSRLPPTKATSTHAHSHPHPHSHAHSRYEARKREQKKEETPRSRRLEMERLWSGGEFSPPIPLEPIASTSSVAPKHAVLFPGSGSQYVGMGHFLKRYPAAVKVWDEAEVALAEFEDWRKSLKLNELDGEVGSLGRILDATEAQRRAERPLREVVFEGPQDELTRSSNAQPAILTTSIAFLRALEDDCAVPIASRASYFLGHSSGEYTAAVASGAISFADGVRLIRLHGLLTSAALSLPSISLSAEHDAPAASRAQMSALVINPGHSHEELAEVIKSIGSLPGATGSQGSVEIASFNSSAQVVLAGSRDGILRASEVLTELGVASRAADLPVSAPFHCSFMKPAAAGMQVALESVQIRSPCAPIVSGLDGTLITTPGSLISNIVSQIYLPVRWSYCLSTLRRSDAAQFVFVGPGKALANLARRDTVNTHEEGEKPDVLSVATDEDMIALKVAMEEYASKKV